MISNIAKEFINLAISKLRLDNPTKTIMNEAGEYLKKAIEQIKNGNIMITTPENCTKIRVGFLASNKQDAINGYIIEKTI